MLSSLNPRIRGVILDMDGVLWKDKQPLVNIPLLFERFNQRGIPFMLATNNASRSISQYQEKLSGFGARVEPWNIINSSMAVVYLLKKQFPQGSPVYVVGMAGLVDQIEEAGFVVTDDQARAVVVGLDLNFNYDKLRMANNLIRQGAVFIATNPDPTYPTPAGLTPGAGSIVAAIETASATRPTIAGKPNATMMEIALERLQTSPLETVCVGDRLDTDILGGQRAGCRTALVMSGVTTPAELDQWEPKPDLIAADVMKLLDE